MIKVDLITGFLGSGKTTFISKYAKYLVSMGERISILVNDYGAVNVDLMLYKDLENIGVSLEMVSGGCDSDCHRRRFKTKLIAMGMQGFNRVIIEPSGVFDIDEFFDCLSDEPLDNWYEIGNIITIIDAKMDYPMSINAEKCLASEISNSGIVLLNKSNKQTAEDKVRLIHYINEVLSGNGINRDIDSCIYDKDCFDLCDNDFLNLSNAGYCKTDYKRFQIDDSSFSSLYYMDYSLSYDLIKDISDKLMCNRMAGDIIRIKGFINENNLWKAINITQNNFQCDNIEDGQDVIIVIGENLNEKLISEYFVKNEK